MPDQAAAQSSADPARPLSAAHSLSSASIRACPPASVFPLLPGVRSRIVPTRRLTQHISESGSPDSTPVVLVHGNASSARFFETLMAAVSATLPDFYFVAPDLRGYGATEAKVVDATRGVRDYSGDIHALARALGLRRFHLLGWSLGGNVAMQYVIDRPGHVLTLLLEASGSPYGYAGTHGPDGAPNFADFAGTGAGLVNSQVRVRYLMHDVSVSSVFSPRTALRRLYVRSPFVFSREREDALVEQMLMTTIGDQQDPGDSVRSPNWPFVAPGRYGPNNALSPKYLNLSGLADVRNGPQSSGSAVRTTGW
jgi:pimeloyl-ACP methyl ester carboxylesterase